MLETGEMSVVSYPLPAGSEHCDQGAGSLPLPSVPSVTLPRFAWPRVALGTSGAQRAAAGQGLGASPLLVGVLKCTFANDLGGLRPA